MKVWYGIVLFDVVWNEVFTDVGYQVVVFSDVAPCRCINNFAEERSASIFRVNLIQPQCNALSF